MDILNTRTARGLTVLVTVLGFYASAAYAQPATLTNGVPITGISSSPGSEKFYKIEVPAGQDELTISTSGGTGDVDLYVRRGSQPTSTSYDYRPYKIGNEETVVVENPAAGTWYIMLKGYSSYAGVTLLAEYSAAISVKAMVNGVPVTNIAGAAGTELYYSIEVPAGQTKLEIAMSGGTGDADLYVKKGSLPTTSSYDYRPFLFGNNETVSVNNPAAATWYIMIRGYGAYDGITLLASYGGGAGTQLENGVAVTNLSGAAGSEKLYRIDVPAGQTNLEIKMSGGTGDADLFVKFGSRPTTTDYDYRPYQTGNNETVTVNNPAAGTWYIMIRAYVDYSGVTLKASYGDVLMLKDGVPEKDLAGALNSQTFFRIDVPAGMDSILFSMSGGTGNADMYIKRGAKPTTSSWDYRPIRDDNTESVSIGGSSVPGTWYVMLRGTKAYSGVTLLADYSVSNTVVQLSNGVPVKDISGSQGTAKYFKIEVPSGQQKLEIAMSGGTGDADLYVRRGSLPTVSEYDYRPYLSGNDESVTVNNPAAGTWYIMIRGYQPFSGITLLATYGGGTVPDEVVELQNGVAVTGISGSAGAEKFYKITVPAGQSKLEIAMSGGTGDVDLYVRKGSKPTTSEWDYRPYLIGNNESVTIDNPSAGTYYIMLRGYVAFSGVTLKATYTPVPEEVIELHNGVALTGLSGASGSEKFFKITVPTGQDFLTIEISGGTGDVDLYVRKGSKPTLTNWDYRPYLIGNNESVEITNPAAAVWYIMLRGYQAYTGLTLKATYGVTIVGNNFAADPNCVAVYDFEDPDQLGADSRGGDDTLVNYGVDPYDISVKQGSYAALFNPAQADHMYALDDNLSAGFPLKSESKNKSFSFSFWVRLNRLDSPGWYYILSKGENNADKRSFALAINTSHQLALQVGYSNGTLYETKTTGSPVTVDTWYHVGVTYNDATRAYRIRVYSDASSSLLFDETGTFSNHINVEDGMFKLGDVHGSGGGYLDGYLDEVAAFNDVLTAAEIDKIRQGTYGKP